MEIPSSSPSYTPLRPRKKEIDTKDILQVRLFPQQTEALNELPADIQSYSGDDDMRSAQDYSALGNEAWNSNALTNSQYDDSQETYGINGGALEDSPLENEALDSDASDISLGESPSHTGQDSAIEPGIRTDIESEIESDIESDIGTQGEPSRPSAASSSQQPRWAKVANSVITEEPLVLQQNSDDVSPNSSLQPDEDITIYSDSDYDVHNATDSDETAIGLEPKGQNYLDELLTESLLESLPLPPVKKQHLRDLCQ